MLLTHPHAHTPTPRSVVLSSASLHFRTKLLAMQARGSPDLLPHGPGAGQAREGGSAAGSAGSSVGSAGSGVHKPVLAGSLNQGGDGAAANTLRCVWDAEPHGGCVLLLRTPLHLTVQVQAHGQTLRVHGGYVKSGLREGVGGVHPNVHAQGSCTRAMRAHMPTPSRRVIEERVAPGEMDAARAVLRHLYTEEVRGRVWVGGWLGRWCQAWQWLLCCASCIIHSILYFPRKCGHNVWAWDPEGAEEPVGGTWRMYVRQRGWTQL